MYIDGTALIVLTYNRLQVSHHQQNHDKIDRRMYLVTKVPPRRLHRSENARFQFKVLRFIVAKGPCERDGRMANLQIRGRGGSVRSADGRNTTTNANANSHELYNN